MKKNYKEKVKMYSALVGGIALASSNDAEAQVVYRDVSPDAVVNGTTTSFDIDFNNDATIDFTLSRRPSGANYTYFELKTTNTNNRSMQGTVSWSVGKLNANDTISNLSGFLGSGTRTLVWGKNGGGNGGGNWLAGGTDKYIGVKFQIGTVDYHGWIRLTLLADLSSATVKDYAYESSPGALIKAGAVSSVPAVTSVIGVDGGNTGNASDLNIGFAKASTETNIAHYRVFVAPSYPALGFNLDTAQLTVAGRYYDIAKTGSNIAKALPSSLLDIYGNAIVNGTAYEIYVMSVGNAGYDDALVVSANTITLEPSVAGATAVVASDIANNGNASDMKVMFTKASSETNVSSYAVLVVPSLIASTANLTTAQAAVVQGNYTTVAKTGADLSVVLSPTAKDVTGAAIAQGTSYEVFVLTISTVASNLGDSLSAASAAVTLTGVTAITDAESIKVGISAYENIISLQSMPSEGNIVVLNTVGAQVFSGKVNTGDNTYTLSNVNTGIYIVQLIMSDKTVSKRVYITK
jgi:hypothetical protein